MLARRAARLGDPLHRDAGTAISLDSGYAFPGVFPDLREASERALTMHRSESLQYGQPFGLPAMREWIAAYMRDDGVDVRSDDVLVVNGAKHGLELICRLLADEGDCVVVTAPTYFSAIPILRSFGLEFLEAAQDEEGMDVEELTRTLNDRKRRGQAPPKFIYDVPDFHNPTGLTMSRRRREALLDVASANGVPIVEDSPYRRLRFEGTREPSLRALARNGTVLSLGTFSKLLAPGLRVGWISAERGMLTRMARLKSDGGTCPLTQRIIVEFFSDGGLQRHLDRARAAYAAHRDAMVQAVRRQLADVEFTVPRGGYYLWLKFPIGADTDAIVERAHSAGVSAIAGSVFFAADDESSAKRRGVPKRFMRLAYSHATPHEIEDGIERLARAYKECAAAVR